MSKFKMKKACETCPFKMSTEMVGAPDWLKDVMNGYKEGLSHSCHQTDANADGFKGVDSKQFCFGFLGLIKNEENLGNEIGLSSDVILGILKQKLDWGEIPTEGIYPSARALLIAYLKHYKVDLSQYLSPEQLLEIS